MKIKFSLLLLLLLLLNEFFYYYYTTLHCYVLIPSCPIHSRYYPFHYAPYMTDIKNFSEMTLEFEMGKPFMPFEQLLAVLPAASRKLLPEPFQVCFRIKILSCKVVDLQWCL